MPENKFSDRGTLGFGSSLVVAESLTLAALALPPSRPFSLVLKNIFIMRSF